MSYLKVLAGAMLLSRRIFLRPLTEGREEMVGIMLPASCPAALVNLAALFSGRTPVNLNWTAGQDNLDFYLKECRITQTITSRRFLAKLKIEGRNGWDYLEDIVGKASPIDKIKYFVLALFLPQRLLQRWFIRQPKDIHSLATVIFSSGSTARPKGVMLSHHNIAANIQSLTQAIFIGKKDVVMGVLPFFHSFGFMATLWLPLIRGAAVVYHHNPLDAPTVGGLVSAYKATIILGTPTFFAAYIRKCSPEQFRSIRCAVAGAEKLKETTARAFYEKFGIVLCEGYGATELSPVACVNAPREIICRGAEGRPAEGLSGYSLGKVGPPVPGVSVKVVDIEAVAGQDDDAGPALPPGQEGVLLVKGPNVMLGYLNQPEKTRQVIKDGWYVTGDLAVIDDQGRVEIVGRLSRFSKIAGEMVPHIRIEEEIDKILRREEPCCAVTSVDDEQRGERLVVLYVGDADIDDLWQSLNQSALPKLWIPRRDSFYQIPHMPLLGSGKLDLRKIKALAKGRKNIKK